jgi:small subunit ribosomal protein S19
MVKKEFTFKGKSVEELKKMSTQEFMQLIPSRERRHLKRGLTDVEKKLLKEIKAGKNNVETHARDMVVVPEMIGKTIKVHNGKEFSQVMINEEMLGHRLGEFTLTRKPVKHGAAGIGSTRGTAHASVH